MSFLPWLHNRKVKANIPDTWGLSSFTTPSSLLILGRIMARRFSLLRSGNSRYLSSLCRLSCASKIRQSSPTLLSLYFWERSRIFMALSSVLGSHLRKLAHRSRTVLIWYSSASLSKCSTFSTKTSSRINFTFNHIKVVD